MLARVLAVIVGIAATAVAWAADQAGKVVSVHDGDTLTVLVNKRPLKVRLASIDAPELGQPYGRKAREALSKMCAGKTADIATHGEDRYGRIIADVTCGGSHANTELVRAGLAWVYVKHTDRLSPLYEIEASARAMQMGLWSDPARVEPWNWRASRR